MFALKKHVNVQKFSRAKRAMVTLFETGTVHMPTLEIACAHIEKRKWAHCQKVTGTCQK